MATPLLAPPLLPPPAPPPAITHDVTIVTTRTLAQARVLGVRIFEPDRLMGYCVAVYFAKLLIFDKVFGLGTTDGLAGFASTTANLIVASYFAKRGFENVARIIKR